MVNIKCGTVHGIGGCCVLVADVNGLTFHGDTGYGLQLERAYVHRWDDASVSGGRSGSSGVSSAS
jgi:hypothetical protein